MAVVLSCEALEFFDIFKDIHHKANIISRYYNDYSLT